MSRPPSRSPQRTERSPQRTPQPGGGQQRPPSQSSGQRPQSQSGGQRPPQQGSGGGSQRPSSADDNKQHTLHYLFDRPGEPIFLPKGDDNAVFDVPSEYIVSIFNCFHKKGEK